MHDDQNPTEPVKLVGAFRFCPSCGHPVLAKDDFGIEPETRVAERTLESLEEIRCGKCFLPWPSCPCGIH